MNDYKQNIGCLEGIYGIHILNRAKLRAEIQPNPTGAGHHTPSHFTTNTQQQAVLYSTYSQLKRMNEH